MDLYTLQEIIMSIWKKKCQLEHKSVIWLITHFLDIVKFYYNFIKFWHFLFNHLTFCNAERAAVQPTPSPQSQPLGAVPPPLQPHPLGAPCSPTPVQLHPRGRQTQLHGSRTCCRATPPQSQPLGAGGPPTVTPPPGGAVQPNPCAATPPGAPDAAARQPDELPYNPSPNPNRWGRWAPHCNPTPWGSRAAQPLCSYTPWRRCAAQPLCSYTLQPHPATGGGVSCSYFINKRNYLIFVFFLNNNNTNNFTG